jgi:hypothetical protein
MSGWQEVSRRRPCAICGHTRWCGYTEDGVMHSCRHQMSHRAVERKDKNGATFWMYRDDPSPPAYKRPETPLPPSAERASARDLDIVYRDLLYCLFLNLSHREALRARGLSDGDMERCGYGSLPLSGRYRVVRHLISKLGQDVISKVPGFIQRQAHDGAWYWALSGPAGLLVPVRNADGAITGLVIRCDDPGDGGRYRWLSSRHAGGPGPEMATHVPRHDGDTHTVRLTEGQLKADVATALSGVLTLGLPGCTQWRLALPVLAQLKSEMVLLAFDADWRTNPHVATALGDCAKQLNKAGFCVKVEDWEPVEGKGVDDVLAAGHSPQLKPWVHALVCKRRGMGRKIRKGVASAS